MLFSRWMCSCSLALEHRELIVVAPERRAHRRGGAVYDDVAARSAARAAPALSCSFSIIAIRAADVARVADVRMPTRVSSCSMNGNSNVLSFIMCDSSSLAEAVNVDATSRTSDAIAVGIDHLVPICDSMGSNCASLP